MIMCTIFCMHGNFQTPHNCSSFSLPKLLVYAITACRYVHYKYFNSLFYKILQLFDPHQQNSDKNLNAFVDNQTPQFSNSTLNNLSCSDL